VRAYYDQAKNSGVKHYHIMLTRTKPYNPAGRYQTEAEARAIDGELQNILPIPKSDFQVFGTEPRDLIDLLAHCKLDAKQCVDIASRFNFQKQR